MKHLSLLLAAFCSVLLAVCAGAQANGKLRIHHMDAGQGDGAVLISPSGQVVVFDIGEDMKRKDCTKPLSYLDQLGIKRIDHLFVSHYHFDHIGCIPAVLEQILLQGDAYDRGASYPGATYSNYVIAVGNHRRTGAIGNVVTLDKNSQIPVVITALCGCLRSSFSSYQ
jgi:beta-lactamase superfamily II metal-dependent hydrolase